MHRVQYAFDSEFSVFEQCADSYGNQGSTNYVYYRLLTQEMFAECIKQQHTTVKNNLKTTHV